MDIDKMHQMALIELEEQKIGAAQDINHEFLREINSVTEAGWGEWTAYISAHGNACYTRMRR